MKNKNFLTFEKALENAFDNDLNSFKFKGVSYDLEDIDDLANYKDLEVYQLGGSSKNLWNAQTGGETNYAQDGKNNINNSYFNKNKSLLLDNNNLVGSKNKGLDREANQSYSKLQQDLLNQEKQKQEFEKNQTFLSEYKPLNPNVRKILERQQAQDEFKRKVFTPVVKGLDIATDIGSLGNFIPLPQAQAIGKISNMIGAGVDLYQTADALREGDYESALINGISLAVPYAIENPKILGSFKRSNKYIDNGNLALKYGRTTYLPVDKLYGKMKSKELYGNRGLLGAVGAETMYDMKQQGGESNNLTIVENGEYVKDNQGKVGKITNIPSHDDNELIIDGESQYVPKGQGGQGTYNVNSVLSATHENRNQSDNTYGKTDEEIKIKPQEALALAEQLNLSIKRPLGSISPSKLMDKLLESREKLVTKYKDIDKPLNFERQANSFVANVDVLKSIPTPEDIYEFLFQNQEDSKSENNEMYAQTGIQLDPAKKGTFKSAATRYGMSMDALATDAKENPEKYSGILRKKANFYRNFVKQTGGLRKSQQDLKNWSDQKWRTNSGKKSSETGERYLPDAAWNNLSASEKARTNRAKREGGGTGNNVPQPKDIAEKTSNYRKAQYGLDDEMYYKSGGSTVNSAGNYTKPEMRKRLFNRIKGESSMGTAAGQWSARKAQKLAKAYKDNGGGYRQEGGKVDAKDTLGRTYTKNDDGSYTSNQTKKTTYYDEKSKKFYPKILPANNFPTDVNTLLERNARNPKFKTDNVSSFILSKTDGKYRAFDPNMSLQYETNALRGADLGDDMNTRKFKTDANGNLFNSLGKATTPAGTYKINDIYDKTLDPNYKGIVYSIRNTDENMNRSLDEVNSTIAVHPFYVPEEKRREKIANSKSPKKLGSMGCINCSKKVIESYLPSMRDTVYVTKEPLNRKQIGGSKADTFKNPLKKYVR